MADKAETLDAKPATDGTPPAPVAPKRSPGHRGADVRDTVAEMAAKAQEISLEAGSKMAAAMKDVISAAAGLSGFAIESARDLVQFMVRRGQMTQDEADKLIREAEEADGKRKPHPVPPPSKVPKPPPPPILKVDPVPSSFVATTMAKAPVRSEPARPSAPVAVAAPKKAAEKAPAKAKKKVAARPVAKSKAPAKSAAKKKPAGRR
jgi:polyhydroxyalkanoate synthesis regulator phasin